MHILKQCSRHPSGFYYRSHPKGFYMNYIFLKLITIILLSLCSRSRFVFSESLQEPPAGVLLLCSEALRHVISRFKPVLGHTLIIYHFTYKTPLKWQISHHSGIYKARNTSGTKGKRTTNGTQNAQSREKHAKNHINFMAFIPLFQLQKPLGCVSKIEILKNPKILDRGDF